MSSKNYVIRVSDDIAGVPAQAWDALLATQSEPTPFMRHAYLRSATESGSANVESGWQPVVVSLWRSDASSTEQAPEQLAAACMLYAKSHSYGEYVFDWAWAQAYEQHGLSYYPKLLGAVPFTPVPGSRLLADSDDARAALIEATLSLARQTKVSSLHFLFNSAQDQGALEAAGLMARSTVQFHWTNRAYGDFDTFLASLSQDKRKKIRAERRKVAEAGVSFRSLHGEQITAADWDFFYRCYSRTYREHGNPPYFTREFFSLVAAAMPRSWLLFVAQLDGQDIACSLIALDEARRRAYGRYWGALRRIDCLHFEACYYQPLAWCIDNAFEAFEGGAQGEHKMARGLLPVKTTSAHWLAHPQFADAVQRFLDREGRGVESYLTELNDRAPFKPSMPG